MAEFRGNLYIFVDAPHGEAGASSTASLDDVFGACEPGTMLWHLVGWAVDNNARGSYCSRTSAKRRNFTTFATAMDFMRRKCKTRPNEHFHLVYEVDGRKSIVTSLEQIQQLDGSAGGGAPLTPSDPAEDPALVILTARVGRIVAANALALLNLLEHGGEAAARSRFSNATYERLWHVLHEAALIEPTPATVA